MGSSQIDCTSNTSAPGSALLNLAAPAALVVPGATYYVVLDALGGGARFTITGGGSALPVKLLNFNGKVNGSVNNLWWTTVSELNSAFHVLEASVDGLTDWKLVGTQRAAGTTNVRHDYKMTDVKPFKRAFYRVRFVDFDGSFEYSNTVLLERNKTSFGFINVYPVPTIGEVKVDYQVDEAQLLTFRVTDVLGRVLDVKTITATEGVNSTTFDLSDYANAIYMITMENGPLKTMFKIVKTN
jgi:hypothetical protein